MDSRLKLLIIILFNKRTFKRIKNNKYDNKNKKQNKKHNKLNKLKYW